MIEAGPVPLDGDDTFLGEEREKVQVMGSINKSVIGVSALDPRSSYRLFGKVVAAVVSVGCYGGFIFFFLLPLRLHRDSRILLRLLLFTVLKSGYTSWEMSVQPK